MQMPLTASKAKSTSQSDRLTKVSKKKKKKAMPSIQQLPERLSPKSYSYERQESARFQNTKSRQVVKHWHTLQAHKDILNL